MLETSLEWLTQHSRLLNIVTTATVLGFSVVPLVAQPKLLKEHPRAWHAFAFWILQWGTLCGLYISFPSLIVPENLPWLLFFIDIQSVFALGFFKAFLDGDAYGPLPVWTGLLVIVIVMGVLDLGLGSLAVATPAGSELRYWWVGGSEMLSATALVLMGGVFIVRFGKIAMWMLITTSLYGFLQRPVYAAIFINIVPDSRPLVALAFWKLGMGALFYLYCLAPLKTYLPIRLQPVDKDVTEHIRKWQKVALPILGAISLVVIGELASRMR